MVFGHFGEIRDDARHGAEGRALSTQREEGELGRVAAGDRDQGRRVVGERGAIIDAGALDLLGREAR